jgi:hypothetical protein
MRRQFRSLIVVTLLVPLTLAAADALAAAQRTFVASYGLTANTAFNCSLAFPCRAFNDAISVTNPGGEVVILDTAGYGPMTIMKSIKIIGPSGVYGGISVLGGVGPPPPPTTGVTINAGDTDVITLRGLDISGVPGVAGPFPNIGIDIQNAGVVHIEKSSIGNFTQDASACINLNTAKAIQVYVNDSFLRECRNGIAVAGTGTDDTLRPNLVVDNTRLEHALNTEASGTAAIWLTSAFLVSVRNSVIAWSGDGIRASNSVSTVNSRVFVTHSQITRMGKAAIETLGGSGASMVVNVSESVLNANSAVLLHGHGAVRLFNNVIANNANGLVLCGGVAANVASLSYGAGVGSNMIADNANTLLPVGCTAYITPTLTIVAQ